jgi:integrase
MASKVILKKQKDVENEGHLAIQHFHFGKKKVVSLGLKIKVTHFDDYFNTEHQRFDRTTVIDYQKFNRVIKAKIDDLTCFGHVGDKSYKAPSFIEYFQKNIDIQTNPSTINTRKSVLNKINEFSIKKKYKDIPFAIIDFYFITELKNFIRSINGGATTKTYMEIVKSVLNRAKKDLLYIEKYNYFEDLDYKICEIDNSALTKEELQGLLSFQSDKNTYFLDMFMIAIFLHGVRASDLFFLRNGDFKVEGIFYRSKKTNKKMAVRYDDKLVTLLCKITGVKSANETNQMNVTIESIISDTPNNTDKNERYGATKRLVKYIDSMPKKDFFFKALLDREPILKGYNKNFEMTKEQHQAYTRLVVFYNSKLKKVVEEYEYANQYKIAKMTSHSSRYTFANLCLEVEHPDVNAISRALGHSSLKTTMDYFNKNFGKERVEKLAIQFNSEFDL